MRLIPLLLVFAFLLPASFARAQTESQTYDPTFMTNGPQGAAKEAVAAQERKAAEQGFISPASVQVSLVRESYMEDNQFGLRMSLPDVVSGCFSYSPLEYEANFVDPYFLDIKVKKYRKIEASGNPDTRKCDPQNKTSSAMMVLDKDDLKSRGVKEIRFSSDAGRDVYKVSLQDDILELIPESMTVFKAYPLSGELKDRLVHDFGNASTIALQVPMVNAGEDITEQVMSFATAHALTPVEKNVTMSLSDNNKPTYYFKDSDGRFAAMIGADGYGEIGTITVMRPYDGPDGRTQTPVELRVFVTRPGTEL